MVNKIKPNKKIRFGVLVNELRLTVWQEQCIKQLIEVKNVDLSLVVVNDSSQSASGKNKNTILFKVFRKLFWSPSASKYALSSDLIKGVPHISCKVVNKGRFSQYFKENDIDAIKDYKLDFLLRFGFGIIRGDVLQAAQYGIWSFHHGDEMRFRGSPAGFWEVFYQVPESGVLLQRITDRLDGGVVLRKGIFKTKLNSYKQNIQQLLLGSTGWPAQVCKDIQLGVADYLNKEASTTQAPIYFVPTSFQVMRICLSMFQSSIQMVFDRFFLKMVWNVGIIDKSIEDLIADPSLKDISWCKPELKDSFIADPCALSSNNENIILLERFYYNRNKGDLEWIKVDNEARILSRESPFKISCHVSYPFLLEDRGEIYMVPETHEKKEVTLYKAEEYPVKWKKTCTLLPDMEILDATIFMHEDRWWLLGTQKGFGSNLRLFAWYSDALEGAWTPHNNNPIKTNIKSTRPAGRPFYIKGQLFRPAQDCSNTYGASIVINRVLKLNPNEFEEREISQIFPDEQSMYPDGVHTLSSMGGKTIIDGKRHEYSLINFIIKIKSFIMRIIASVRI